MMRARARSKCQNKTAQTIKLYSGVGSLYCARLVENCCLYTRARAPKDTLLKDTRTAHVVYIYVVLHTQNLRIKLIQTCLLSKFIQTFSVWYTTSVLCTSKYSNYPASV